MIREHAGAWGVLFAAGGWTVADWVITLAPNASAIGQLLTGLAAFGMMANALFNDRHRRRIENQDLLMRRWAQKPD